MPWKSPLEQAFGQNSTQLFSTKVAAYQAARPDYPTALFDWLASHLPVHPEVLDIGAGTGLFTQGLLARGWRVLAVEPDAAMRAACDARLSNVPHYRSAAGLAEALPADDHSVDLITAAQSFHWFDPVPARRECTRVLKPGGRVALIWNDRDEAAPIHQDLNTLFAQFGGAARAAQVADNELERAAQFLGAGAQFWHGPHHQLLDAEGLEALVFSRSYMPSRESHDGNAVVRALGHLFDRHQRQGQVRLPYQTRAWLG
ncbi:class I SAM-dependent methyltransferase [Inhella gelatinilytica]|uniref:Class I SAM-dependent methyltransferase n=1 Tax=Inhella gelatinilytica TaxID=2795030 RepID=A0A931NC05_9BURK|nr:class I SAM-dependent methyltransferase [Inhella gelatinilytica]MBH9551477.1 class I SAM-dependent methyltransferase [Inhella gelatinilytica]